VQHDSSSPSLSHEHEHEHEEALESDTSFAPPSLNPFFTLIEDTQTSEHHHPTVHYIFADDEVEIITEAACRSLLQNFHQHAPREDIDTLRLPQLVAEVQEHYLVLDVRPTTNSSYEVSHAQSFSPEWQVVNTNITNAPTISEGGEEGLMLKVQVRPNTLVDKDGQLKETMEEMVERFRKRLDDIKVVMNAGALALDQGTGKNEGTGP